MKATAISNLPPSPRHGGSPFSSSSPSLSRQFAFPIKLKFQFCKGLLHCGHSSRSRHLINGGRARARAAAASLYSAWDDKPYEVLPGGKRAYFDEQDVVSFLDPPKLLIPLDPSSYNPAAYLWKKLADIPEERRHRLLSLLKPRLISRAWEVAGTRYDDPKVAKKTASSLLASEDGAKLLEFWHCRTNGGPMAVAWINYFKMALFRCEDGTTYGRVIDASVLRGLSNSFYPLYFTVRQVNEVMSTEQPCDLAYEFGDGLLNLNEYPEGFPKPEKHPWPFNDQVVIYIRNIGPGILVGQAWQEGEELQQVPKKLCGEILMVKDYGQSDRKW